jgi:hypothetical protein
MADKSKTKKTTTAGKEKKEKKEKGKTTQSKARRKRKIDLISSQKSGTRHVMLLEGCQSNIHSYFSWQESDILGTGAFAKV